jgi:hypothetical protein
MTNVAHSGPLYSSGLEEMLAQEVGYHQLILWLATLDPKPLQAALELPDGALTVRREVAITEKRRLDLVFDVDGVPRAVATVKLGVEVLGNQKWVFDQWCGIRTIEPQHRFVISLDGDTVPGWDADPVWQTSVSILSLLNGWRDTSELSFVRELALHAHALAEEVALQTRDTLAHVESDVARRLISKRLRASFQERYPDGSGVSFPVNAEETTGGVSSSLCVPVAAGGHIILEVQPRGGAHAKPGCEWGIRILAAVNGPSLLSHETEALALLAVPSFSVDRLRERLEVHGLCHLATRLSAAKLASGTKIAFDKFDSETNVAAKKWHERFRVGKRPLAGPNHPLLYGQGEDGLGLQFYVENTVTVDELQEIALVLAEMLRDTVPKIVGED